MEILAVRENKLIGRREVLARVKHEAGGTPSREALRGTIAEALKVPVDQVYIRVIKTEYGTGESLVRAHVYDDPDRALRVEPSHVVRKNRGKEGGEE